MVGTAVAVADAALDDEVDLTASVVPLLARLVEVGQILARRGGQSAAQPGDLRDGQSMKTSVRSAVPRRRRPKACGTRWRRWVLARGDQVAAERVQHGDAGLLAPPGRAFGEPVSVYLAAAAPQTSSSLVGASARNPTTPVA